MSSRAAPSTPPPPSFPLLSRLSRLSSISSFGEPVPPSVSSLLSAGRNWRTRRRLIGEIVVLHAKRVGSRPPGDDGREDVLCKEIEQAMEALEGLRHGEEQGEDDEDNDAGDDAAAAAEEGHGLHDHRHGDQLKKLGIVASGVWPGRLAHPQQHHLEGPTPTSATTSTHQHYSPPPPSRHQADPQLQTLVHDLHVPSVRKVQVLSTQGRVHPFTGGPLITTTSGPAADAHTRLEAEERRHRLLSQQGIVPDEDEKRKLLLHLQHHDELTAAGAGAGAGDAATMSVGARGSGVSAAHLLVAQSSRSLLRTTTTSDPSDSPSSPTQSSDDDDASKPPERPPLTVAEEAERYFSEVMSRDPLELLALTGGGPAVVAAALASRRASLSSHGSPPKSHRRSRPIIGRRDDSDPLFAHLMGAAAERAARPKTNAPASKTIRAAPSILDSKKPKPKAFNFPPLRMRLREKITVKLTQEGTLKPVTETFVELIENFDTPQNLLPMRINFVGKCKFEDPYPLMPSVVPPLHLTEFAEPLRDRNKDWRLESQRDVLGTEVDVSVGRIKARKDEYKQLVHSGAYSPRNLPPEPKFLGAANYPNMGHDSRELVYAEEAGSLISREMLWRGAVQVSRSYCVLTAYGMGISGRVYAEGLHIPRYILLQAFTKADCQNHEISVSMEMLEILFKGREEFLKVGMKKPMIFELCKMLYMEYEVFEQYVNDPADTVNSATPEAPPKVTHYKHNDMWHTDDDDDDHNDDDAGGNNANKGNADDASVSSKKGKKKKQQQEEVKKEPEQSLPKEEEEEKKEEVAAAAVEPPQPPAADGGVENSDNVAIPLDIVITTSTGTTAAPASADRNDRLDLESLAGDSSVGDLPPLTFKTTKGRGRLRTLSAGSSGSGNLSDRRSPSPESRRSSTPDKRPGTANKDEDPSKSPKNDAVGSPSSETGGGPRLEPGSQMGVWQRKKVWVVEHLRISRGRKFSSSDLRRDELRRRRLEEAEAADLARTQWASCPKRYRGMIMGRAARISGHLVVALAYEFKQQPGMFKIKITDVYGHGTYELKISASALGKMIGLTKGPEKWTSVQKRLIAMNFCKTDGQHSIVAAKAGRLSLETVVEESVPKSVMAWHFAGRKGPVGSYVKRRPWRDPVIRKDFVQVKMAVAGNLNMADPMEWELDNVVAKFWDLRHPYKPKKKESEGSSHGKGTTVVKGARGRASTREDPTARPSSRESTSASAGSRPGTTQDKERPSSREGRATTTSREFRPTAGPGELLDIIGGEDGEREADKADEGERHEFVSYAHSSSDFALLRASQDLRGVSPLYSSEPLYDPRVVDTVKKFSEMEEAADKYYLSCAHSNAYCIRKQKQIPSSTLGLNYHMKGLVLDPERKARSVFRIGCKPKREIGNGRRMASGVANIDGLRGIFDFFRSGTGSSFNCTDGLGEDLLMFFHLCSEVPEKFKGKMQKNTTYRFKLNVDDCYRCSGKDAEAVLKGDPDVLEEVRAKNNERLMEIKKEESVAYEACKDELRRAKKLDGKFQADAKEKAEDAFKEVKLRLKLEKEMLKQSLNNLVEVAEEAWGNLAREVFKRSTWYEMHNTDDQFVLVNGALAHVSTTLPAMFADIISEGSVPVERTAAAPAEQQRPPSQPILRTGSAQGNKPKSSGSSRKVSVVATLAPPVEPPPPKESYITLKFDTTAFYQGIKVSSTSAYRDNYRHMIFTISQEKYTLRFIGYDPEYSDYYIFSYPAKEQEEMVRSLKGISPQELRIQFKMCFLGVEYRDDGVIEGTKRRKFKVLFASELEAAGSVQVHMTEQERRQAERNLDKMMQATGERAKSREKAASHRLLDSGPAKWGEVQGEE